MKAQIFNYRFWIKEIDPYWIKSKFQSILLKSGFKIIKTLEHHFSPYGYTSLFLLAESHLAIHTFPEENKSYIELSSCNANYFTAFKNNLALDSGFNILSE